MFEAIPLLLASIQNDDLSRVGIVLLERCAFRNPGQLIPDPEVFGADLRSAISPDGKTLAPWAVCFAYDIMCGTHFLEDVKATLMILTQASAFNLFIKYSLARHTPPVAPEKK